MATSLLETLRRNSQRAAVHSVKKVEKQPADAEEKRRQRRLLRNVVINLKAISQSDGGPTSAVVYQLREDSFVEQGLARSVINEAEKYYHKPEEGSAILNRLELAKDAKLIADHLRKKGLRVFVMLSVAKSRYPDGDDYSPAIQLVASWE